MLIITPRFGPQGSLPARFAVVCTICLAGLADPGQSALAEFLLVVPPELESIEGDTYAVPPLDLPIGARRQDVYPASFFSELPAGQTTIVSMAWRPDHTVTSEFSFSLEWEIWLSTSSAAPGSMSTTFAANRGADETLVYSGPITLQTAAAGPAEGPRPFDYVIPFQTPFAYDPSQGNLLIELSLAPGAEGCCFDAQTSDGSTTILVAAGADASTATNLNSEFQVAQFTFVSDASALLPGDYNNNGLVEQADLDLVLLNWGSELIDPGAAGWLADLPDGSIDQQELDKVLLGWGSSTATAVATSAVPEPSGFVLVLVSVAICAACRRQRRE